MVAHSTSPLAAHWDLDPEVSYLNHGSFGATPRAVIEEQRRWQTRLEANPMGFLESEVYEALAAARKALAELLSCDAGDLALIENATSGVNTVLRSLRFEPGDEILVPDHAYQACRNTIDYVAERWGATVVTVNLPFPIDGPEVVMERVMAGVTDRTVLAMIDTVTSPTGLRMPFEALVEALESRGVAVLLDAAHGIGMVPLALDDLGASYTTTNAHKWLSAPKGSAVLHVRKDRQAEIHPLTISHGMTFPLGETTRFRHEFDWTGTRDPSAWCALPFTVEHVGGMVEGGWPEIMARNDALCLEARQLLCDRLGLEVPCPPEMLACIATLRIPETSIVGEGGFLDPLYYRLAERGIRIPVWSWPSPAGRYFRISAYLYNSIEQYHHLADVIEEELAAERS